MICATCIIFLIQLLLIAFRWQQYRFSSHAFSGCIHFDVCFIYEHSLRQQTAHMSVPHTGIDG